MSRLKDATLRIFVVWMELQAILVTIPLLLQGAERIDTILTSSDVV